MIDNDRDRDGRTEEPERGKEAVRSRLVSETKIHEVGNAVGDQERARAELGGLFEGTEHGERGGQSTHDE